MRAEEMPSEVPVLVVGGGPVGLACAFELDHHQVGCLVVEPRREVTWSRPRAKTTSARTMEHLRRWGIARQVREAALLPVGYSDEVVFCTALTGREITRFDNCFALTPGEVDLYAEAGQQIPQPLFEMVLRRALEERSNAHLASGWRLESLEQREDMVLAELIDDAGARRRIAAEYVIGADGARSVVRGAIGSDYVGATDLRPNMNLVFRAAGLHEAHRFGRAIHYWVLNPRIAGVLGPMDQIDQWWVIATGPGVVEDEPGHIVDELVGRHVDAEITSTDPWSARMAVASSYGDGRVFLVGDAAHLNPPWGGHGFNTGVGDAVNLCWKLAARLEGWGGPRLLDSYEAERRQIAEETVALATRNMAVLAVDLADPLLEDDGDAADRRRDEVAAAIQATKSMEFHSLGLVLGYRYDASPVIADDGSPRPQLSPERFEPLGLPGERLAHRWIAPGDSLFDHLGKGITLIAPEGADTGELRGAAMRAKVPLELASEPTGAAGPNTALLVRPDQHIAWRGEPGSLDTAGARALLARVVGA